MKKLFRTLLISAFVFILTFPVPANAWWLWVSGYPVQEGTQLGRLDASIKEIAEQLEMIKQHLAMLKSLKSGLMQLGTGQIMDVFTEAQGVLQSAKTLTSGLQNFESAFKEHFPDYDGPEVIKATDESGRFNKDWRSASEAYLKTLNMTARNFENEQAARDRMMDMLNESDPESGQTKAIQIIGAMANHTAFLLDRNNMALSGFMENYLTRKQIERERKKIAQKNVVTMGKAASETEKSGTRYNTGFK